MDANSVKISNELVINDSNRKIKITNEIIELFKRYMQIGEEHEAGGILIGREDANNGNLVIEYATFPMKYDIRKRYRFYRKDKGHIEYYNKIYKDSDGIYAYIGEWHTHPENEPVPSIMDKINWKRILNKKGNGELFNIIVGAKKIRVWKCHDKNKINLIEDREVK